MQVMAVDGVILSELPTSLLLLCLDAFEIRRLSSVFLRVRTNVGVRVLYDREGLRLYLQVDQRWVEDTVGLCGTFNGNTQDDFLYVPWAPEPEGEGEAGPLRYAPAAKSLQSCPTLCDPIDSSPPGSLSLGFSRQEHWSGLPFPSPMQESEK